MHVATLVEVFEYARQVGLLGPGPVDGHVEHAKGFAEVVGDEEPARVLDLGSGAGVPGLVLAHVWPEAEVVLLDSGERRARFLEEAVERLGLAPRVGVLWARAEEAGREQRWRGWAEVVVARSFGPPAVTAECAAPLLTVGGSVVISEPPEEGGGRWPAEGLAALGLRPGGGAVGAGRRFQRLRQEEPCPPRYPRRPGIPAKRPLF